MKYLVTAWAAPLVLFWAWYFLSVNDINFGSVYLSRELHVLIFDVFGLLLHRDPAEVPGIFAQACFVDMLMLGAIWAFRRRRELSAWASARYERYLAEPAAPVLVKAQPDEPSA